MIKIFQKQWFDIPFKELGSLSPHVLADGKFYSLFYSAFYTKYTGYDALPAHYVTSKRHTAKHLTDFIIRKNAQTILSIGCGNGIIEKEIGHALPNITIDAYESNAANSRWLRHLANIALYSGDFPACLPPKKYDLVYLSCVEYALTDTEYSTLLAQLRNVTDAPVILTSLISPYPTYLAFIKYWIKFTIYKMKLYDPGQLWGYLRHHHQHCAIINQAGYRVINNGTLTNGQTWIEISPKQNEPNL